MIDLYDAVDRLFYTYWHKYGSEAIIAFVEECAESWDDPDLMDMSGFECIDCGVNTADNDEYYMIHDDLWNKVSSDVNGMMCIGCVENKLGRQLTSKDFTDAPINSLNHEFRKSTRLLDRLGN